VPVVLDLKIAELVFTQQRLVGGRRLEQSFDLLGFLMRGEERGKRGRREEKAIAAFVLV